MSQGTDPGQGQVNLTEGGGLIQGRGQVADRPDPGEINPYIWGRSQLGQLPTNGPVGGGGMAPLAPHLRPP